MTPISKSISKWVWLKDKEVEHKFKARQAEKGRKGGLAKGKIYYNKRISAQILKENGMSLAEIAREIDVSQVTIKRWFKK